METLRVVGASLTASELLRGLTIAVVFSRFLSSRSADKTLIPTWRLNKFTEIIKISGFFLLFIFARSWLGLVDHYVPEPYLDEVFHIPQAQTYCQGRFWDWDDKITTPPGLYLLSVANHKLWRLAECTSFSLRNNNVLDILLIALLAALCRDDIEARTAEQQQDSRPTQSPKKRQFFSLYTCHTALNIALFPVLFFFSGLYYTDVASTLLVLLAYKNHLGRLGKESPDLISDFLTVVFGVATLFMRQTNVFWVVVYMGGVEAVHAIRCLKPEPEERPPFTTLEEHVRFFLSRCSVGDIEDPRVDLAWPDDWLTCLLSIAVAALCNPVKVLRQVWPHITILALFGGFVAWNGGVVLGDKSNHIATIHLAQMLYIWPFFAFFSAPLFLPTIVGFLLSPFKTLYTLVCGKHHRAASGPTQSSRRSNKSSPALKVTTLVSVRKVYHPLYLVATILLSLAVVKFNTIIHPFTLADNRHYMFYVFRYTIRRSLKVRYLLVGAYTLSRWLVWGRLAGYNNDRASSPPINTYILVEGSSKGRTSDDTLVKEEENNKTLGTLDDENSYSTTPPLTSTVLFWLLTTSLSLITAPLVEPRYFILPWVFYRLLVPAWRLDWSPSSQTEPPREAAAAAARSSRNGQEERKRREKEPSKILIKLAEDLAKKVQVDLSLLLETAWFIAINLGTMYMFLYKPFYRRVPVSGELLDGGRVQRFMW
ncbi:DIE2/ALG10 family-domain-containing protein [Rhypophila decipiens]|uniref:Dol-P-Glc:Glc(2)Man(9)GlcNAc(2)-PP-Dol alpha-1,2-glucosyltransferase n=1 Tax=Rhypophila decipiens TaxID=261697 RepID=A0AAN6Y7L8_9PEZI|nr:DIE2/ALG10 family-domain-containing protein [Rhypophila decipiens]